MSGEQLTTTCEQCGGLGKELLAGKLEVCADCGGEGRVPAVAHYELSYLAGGSSVPCGGTCGHEHQPALGGICVGCPCEWRPPVPAPQLLAIPREHRPVRSYPAVRS